MTVYKILRDFNWGELQLSYGEIFTTEKDGSLMRVSNKHYPERTQLVTEKAFYNFVQAGYLQLN